MEKKEKEEKEEEKVPKKYEKQTKFAVIIMIIILLSVVLVHWVIQESRKVEYRGLEFQKVKEGSIIFYKALLEYILPSGEKIPFFLKLRNDPLELARIEFDGIVKLKKRVVLSLSPRVSNCSDTYITTIDFARTLTAFGYEVSAGTTDEKYAKENNASLVNCKDAINKSVIVMKEGEETKIKREDDCYIIEIKDCGIQQGFERFALSLVTDSRVY